MSWLESMMPRSITTQVAGLVALSVLFGMALAVAVLWLVLDPPSNGNSPMIPMLTVARVTEVTRLVQTAKTPAEVDTLLKAVQRGGLDVERVAVSDLVPSTTDDSPSFASQLALRRLASQPGVELLKGLRYPAGPPSQIVTRLDQGHALMFDLVVDSSLWPILLTPTALFLMTVLISMLLLSVYAVRWVVAPLADVARAATSFGRSPQGNDELTRRGPREIVQVTDALNDMRTRIRALLDDRTRMLAAISHDVRTPLTRLRLRTERVSQDDLRTAMQSDLTKVSHMLDETLDYLRDDARSEATTPVDLPSLLQTICSELADRGHAVSYVGPTRLSYACRPRALTRAITNIVENAVKHGSSIVTVALGKRTSDRIEIEVADDGPGIPAALRDKVFEPFFKADDTRKNSGFGLGLSIAQDIIKRHGGGIEMHPRDPTGLRVLLVLSPKHRLT